MFKKKKLGLIGFILATIISITAFFIPSVGETLKKFNEINTQYKQTFNQISIGD